MCALFSGNFRPSERNQQSEDLSKYSKINIGCGHNKYEGYLNVDVDPACKPDLLIKDNDFSVIPKYHFTEILANDVLEHIPRSQTLSALLDWSRFLKPDGKLILQTSSITGVAEQLSKSSSFADHYGWTNCLFGNQAHPGDFHHNGFTEQTLKTYLLAAGYKIDSFELRDKWLFHVVAHKAQDWASVIKEAENDDNESFIQKIFQSAFGHEPTGFGYDHIKQGLESGTLTRLEATKHLLQSPERLYITAERNNL